MKDERERVARKKEEQEVNTVKVENKKHKR